MAEAIMRRLIGLGIVVLPIHDSFIAAAHHEGALKEAMDDSWARFVGGEAPRFIGGEAKRKSTLLQSFTI
jgi:hypothetical protein